MHRNVAVVVAALALLPLAAGSAAADDAEDADDARTVATMTVTALASGEHAALAGLFKYPLALDVDRLGWSCRAAPKRRARIARKQGVAVARCLIALQVDLRGAPIQIDASGRGYRAWIERDVDIVVLTLARAGGSFRVTGVSVIEQIAGEEGGVESGVVGGVVDGMPAPPPPPPPPPPRPPQLVTPLALQQLRIAGSDDLTPDAATRDALLAAGTTKVMIVARLCVSAAGGTTSATLLKSSGFPDWDQAIVQTLRGWRHRPFLINGKAAPVCAALQLRHDVK